MKLYKILPTCGLALGVALVIATSAFTKAPKDKSGDTLYTFQYNAPPTNPYSQANVENVANWSYTTSNPSCDNTPVKACSLQVPESYVDNPGSSPTLDASIDITTGGSASVAYVASTASSSAVIENKSN